jgi:hypothetical protein
MATDLTTAITSEQWNLVVQIANTRRSACKTWTTRQGLFEGIKDANVLPIHEALVAGAPYNVIEALLAAYPDSVYCKESSYKRLPLHCACRKNAISEVVELLLKQYSDAALAPDSLGRLPCKYDTRLPFCRGIYLFESFSCLLPFQCIMLYRMVPMML